MLKSIFLVASGSALGGALRFLVGRVASGMMPGHFPLGTFLCNITGCFLIGIIYALSDKYNWMSPNMRLLLAVGLCGGFTTFSSFIRENAELARQDLAVMFLYAGTSLLVGFMVLYLGYYLIKAI